MDKLELINKIPLLDILFGFLKDINWPGSIDSIHVLSNIPKAYLMPCLEKYILEACREEDSMWLGGLKLLVEKALISSDDFSDISVYNILNNSEF